MAVYAGTNGLFDAIPVPEIRRAEEELHRFMTSRYATLLGTIREKKVIDDATKEQVNAALKEFTAQFAASIPAKA